MITTQSAEIDKIALAIREDMKAFLATAAPLDQYTAAELRQRLRQKLEDRFFASPVSAEPRSVVLCTRTAAIPNTTSIVSRVTAESRSAHASAAKA